MTDTELSDDSPPFILPGTPRRPHKPEEHEEPDPPIIRPGEYRLGKGDIYCNVNRKTIKITVKNTGDRPCQIGSHTHFFEINKSLEYPRSKTFGYRLNIPAGTSVRFEPGDLKEVKLCELGGKRIVYGFNALTMGSTRSTAIRNAALDKARKRGFKGT